MQLRILSLVGITLALAACTDDGVIGSEVTSAAGAGARSTGGANAGGASATGGTTFGGTTFGGTTFGGTTFGGSTAMGGRTIQPTAGSGNEPAQALASATATRCGIVIAETPSVSVWTLPSTIVAADPSPLWDTLLPACIQGGWDLDECAGSDTLYAVAATNETRDGNPVVFHTIMMGDRVCCAYQSYNPVPPNLGAPMLMSADCGPHDLAANALSYCEVTPTGEITALELDVPTDLSGPNWGVKASTCSSGAWDLSMCAGTKATFTSFGTSALSPLGTPMTTWVITNATQVCCVYDSDSGATAPGLYAHVCGV